jgi:hypothetical protein
MFLKKTFLLDFVEDEPFMLEIEQYLIFLGYLPALWNTY